MAAFLLSFLLALGGLPEATALRGAVADSTGRPIPEARIVVEGETTAHVAGPDGRFEAGPLADGPHHLIVSAPGFQTWEGTIQLPSADIAVTLQRVSIDERVVVTATRGDVTVRDPAAATSVLSSSDLSLSASTALDDALRSTPGFSLFRRTSSKTANPTAQGATLRGLSASGASRAIVLADGIPLNDPFGGWVYWDRVPRAAIEHVDVVRGGISDLYGADAVGGVIQIITARPDAPEVRLALDGDSTATARASTLAAWSGSGAHIQFAGEASRTDGSFVVSEDDRGAVDRRAGVDYLTGRVQGGYDWSSGWRAKGHVGVLAESRQNGTELQLNDTSERDAGGSAAGPLAGGLWEGAIQAGDQTYHQTFSSISATRDTETLTTRQTVPASSVMASTTWRRLAGTSDIIVGADVRQITATNAEVSFAPNGSIRGTTDTPGFERSGGLFAQLRVPIGDRITLVGGARGDSWQRERGGHSVGEFSPRAVVSVRLSHWLAARGSVNRAFRVPTLNERIRNFRVGNVLTLANHDLQPETLLMTEGGLLAQGSRGSLRTSVFTTWLDHAVTNVTLTTTPSLITRQRQNAGSVRATGLESEGDWRLARDVSLLGSLALTHSRFEDTPGLSGNHVPQVPDWQVTGGVRWTAPRHTSAQVQLRSFGQQVRRRPQHPRPAQRDPRRCVGGRAARQKHALGGGRRESVQHRVRHGADAAPDDRHALDRPRRSPVRRSIARFPSTSPGRPAGLVGAIHCAHERETRTSDWVGIGELTRVIQSSTAAHRRRPTGQALASARRRAPNTR